MNSEKEVKKKQQFFSIWTQSANIKRNEYVEKKKLSQNEYNKVKENKEEVMKKIWANWKLTSTQTFQLINNIIHGCHMIVCESWNEFFLVIVLVVGIFVSFCVCSQISSFTLSLYCLNLHVVAVFVLFCAWICFPYKILENRQKKRWSCLV